MSRDWREWAACRDRDPDLFFPVGTSGPALTQVRAAKAVCARCPVQTPCLEFALEALPEGIAGGMTAHERRGLRPRRSRRGPRGVRGLVVTALVGGEAVAGATVAELVQAARLMRRCGCSGRRIAQTLGVNERRIYRWLGAAS